MWVKPLGQAHPQYFSTEVLLVLVWGKYKKNLKKLFCLEFVWFYNSSSEFL